MLERRDTTCGPGQAVAPALSDDEVGEGKDYTPTFLHLRQARVFVPGQEGMPDNGMFWRGRLSEVTGWALGHLGVAAQDTDEN